MREKMKRKGDEEGRKKQRVPEYVNESSLAGVEEALFLFGMLLSGPNGINLDTRALSFPMVFK